MPEEEISSLCREAWQKRNPEATWQRVYARQVPEWIDGIKARLSDPEVAHMVEDQLLEFALRAIADGSEEDPVALAKAVLPVFDLKYPRNY